MTKPPYGGGVGGAVIGVSNMDKSLTLYRDILGYDNVVVDETHSCGKGSQVAMNLIGVWYCELRTIAGPFRLWAVVELVQALTKIF